MEEKLPSVMPEPADPDSQLELPGFYDLTFSKGETDALDLNQYGDLIDEITLLRVFIRRALMIAQDIGDLKEIVRLLNAIGLAASRLSGLIKIQHKLDQRTSLPSQAARAALDEIIKELGIK